MTEAVHVNTDLTSDVFHAPPHRSDISAAIRTKFPHVMSRT